MTIQIGMVGTDGIILAGDTRWTHDPRLRRDQHWAGGRYGTNGNKIKISYERGIAVSRALDMEVAGRVADRIISELRYEDLIDPVGAIERIGGGIPSHERRNAHCFIVLTHPTLQLLLFQFVKGDTEQEPFCKKWPEWAIAGDNTNAAIFWAERYYDESLSVDQLIPIASHLIISAAKLSTASIQGLEIIRCDASGIRRLSNESILELKRRTDEWDRQFGDLIRGNRQEFTYANAETDR
jgi:hypothetical protein